MGEVYGADRPFVNAKPIPGIVPGHLCGTQADFNGQAIPLPTDMRAPIGADGLPLCCPRVPVGPFVLSGTGATVPFNTCYTYNGSLNGEDASYDLATPNTVSNSFRVYGKTNISSFVIGLWTTDAEFIFGPQMLQVGSTPFGTDLYNATVGTGGVFQFINDEGFYVYYMTYNVDAGPLMLNAGTYWLTLGNIDPGGYQWRWDVSSGPSEAFDNSGSIPSEYFCVEGSAVTKSTAVFSSPGIFFWSWPPGVSIVSVGCVGAGGGGGIDWSQTGAGAGGGGGGGSATGTVTRHTETELKIQVGTGGSAMGGSTSGEFGNGQGFPGIGSSVSQGRMLVVGANGGQGGFPPAGASTGGAGGTGATGGFPTAGASPGSNGSAGSGGPSGSGGNGGDSPGGGIGASGGSVSIPDPLPGGTPGGGGGGGLGAIGGVVNPSSAGGNGRIKLTWTIP